MIGGGITGLTTTYYLQKMIEKKDLSIDVKLIEASHRLGGKIQTVYKDGFIIERGPESFLKQEKAVKQFAEDVGLKDELVNNVTGKCYVVVNEGLHCLPEGAVMGVPTKISPFLTTNLFSVQGKMRACADFILPRSHHQDDQSLGSFFRRRFGDEVVENLIEPLLSRIYGGDIDRLSLMSTFPQFYEVERKYRSLILGMKKASSKLANKHSSKENQGEFLTFKGGLQSFVHAIEKNLPSTSIRKGLRVTSIENVDDGNGYELHFNNGQFMRTDSIVIALPHLALPSLFPQCDCFHIFKQMPATSVATVAMAFNADEVRDHLDGTGFVVARNSDYTITACTWINKKWPHTAPEGKVLLRCYVGRAGEETVVDLPDEEIEQIVLGDLKRAINFKAKPEFTIVTRWKQSMPQYTVGHCDRLVEVRKRIETQLPGVFIAGSSFEGIALPDCIDQGKKAAHNVLSYFQ